ncbi:hypothetical protein A4X13_0g4584 [Tilletia indica]|uniref:Uncharacterized protein n=1 Tax=Tilletia indica TaxID=43049 RepID=A0A177TGH5_9BASI|nr:hypothetical protein A4X13_0g4584 [Tilletia indica]
MSRTAPSTARPSITLDQQLLLKQQQQPSSSSASASPAIGSTATTSRRLAAVAAAAAHANPPPPPSAATAASRETDIDIVISRSSSVESRRSLSPNLLKRPLSPPLPAAHSSGVSLQPPPPASSSCSSPSSSRSSSLSNQHRVADHYQQQQQQPPAVLADSGYPSGPIQAHPLPPKPDAPLPARPQTRTRSPSGSRSVSRPRSHSQSQNQHNYPHHHQNQHHHSSQLHHLHHSSSTSSSSAAASPTSAPYPSSSSVSSSSYGAGVYGTYHRSSHHSSSLSSFSARSHPSPATSLSSASTSSLRTPPDLLLNPSSGAVLSAAGNLIGGAGILGDKDKKYYSLLQQDSQQVEPTRTLSMDAIKERLKLIDSLGKGQGAGIKDALPRPPHGRNGTKISADTKLSVPKPAESSGSKISLTKLDKQQVTSMAREKESNRLRPSPDRLRDATPTDSGSVSRKRKPRGDESDNERAPTSKKAKGSSSSLSASASASSSKSRSVSRTPSERSADGSLPPKNWTLEMLQDCSRQYKVRGRQLKHSGDRRTKEFQDPGGVGGSQGLTRQESNETAALEHTDAILHYVYAFWCDDQIRALTATRKGGSDQQARLSSSSSSTTTPSSSALSHCTPANWITLFGLLEFSTKLHQRMGWTHLAGLCKLVEAMVRHMLVCHEQRALNARMGKLNASAQVTLPMLLGGKGDEEMMETAPPTPGGPESQAGGGQDQNGSSRPGVGNGTSPSKSGNGGGGLTEVAASSAVAANATESHLKELSEVTESLSRLTRESERVSLLFTEARSALSYTVLREHFPLTWAACISSDLDAASSAADLEPDEAVCFGSEGRICLARFAWPIEYNSGVTHVVCFGRALVAELARGRRVGYVPAPVMSAPVG